MYDSMIIHFLNTPAFALCFVFVWVDSSRPSHVGTGLPGLKQ